MVVGQLVQVSGRLAWIKALHSSSQLQQQFKSAITELGSAPEQQASAALQDDITLDTF